MLHKFRRGKFSPGKIFVGENFRHLTKISSLFPDEVFPDKVLAFKLRHPSKDGIQNLVVTYLPVSRLIPPYLGSHW